MVQHITYAKENFEQLYLVGFRLGAAPYEQLLYTIVLYYEASNNDQNRPLTSDDRIIFFTMPERSEFALSLGDAAFRKYGQPPREVAAIYDVARVLQLVQTGDRDESAEMVNSLNELLDLVRATREPVPDDYRTVLHELADHATFSRALGEFLDAIPGRRRLALDAIYWSIGLVTTRARIVK